MNWFRLPSKALILCLVLSSCNKGEASQQQNEEPVSPVVAGARETPSWFSEGLTYQLMPRCFCEEGDLNGARKHLSRLKDLGVTVIYFTPLTVADTDSNQSYWSSRQKKSGFNDPRNPYRTGDYMHVDPEYGTEEDLAAFIGEAHDLGMKVIMDLVFLHCGPGCSLITSNPEYFQHNGAGDIVTNSWHFPVFDFDNTATRKYFKALVRYYLTAFDADGFRCDVADDIPLDFWEELREDAESVKKDIVFVAEGEEADNTLKAFDANYSWQVSREMRKVLHSKEDALKAGGAAYARSCHESAYNYYPKGTLLWSMMENHDWANDSYEDRAETKYGHANCELGLAFIFAIDGVPFIFCGQEACWAGRVSIFGHEGCWIDWDNALATPEAVDRAAKIKKWVKMRKDNPTLVYGKTKWIDTDHPAEICAFKRTSELEGGKDVLFVGNCSAKDITVGVNGKQYSLGPWGYIFE